MTVRELITMLLDQRLDAEAVIPVFRHDDYEYATVAAVEGGRYVPYETWSGAASGFGDFITTTPANAHTGVGTPAVVILPKN